MTHQERLAFLDKYFSEMSDEEWAELEARLSPSGTPDKIKYGYVRIDGDRITGIVTTMEDIKANPRNGYVVIDLNDLTEQNKSA